MMISTKITEVREKAWILLQKSLEVIETAPNLRSKEGTELIYEIIINSETSQYQLYEETENDKYLIYEVFLDHFIRKTRQFKIKGIKRDSQEFRDSVQLRHNFEENFKLLEEEILLNTHFEYQLYIPSFRISLPEGSDCLVLDDEHRIFKINNNNSPLGIKDFSDPAPYWDPINQKSSYRKANTYFEVDFRIKKRLSTEDAYKNFSPYYPATYEEYNIFDEKVRSLCDFFFCKSPILDFAPFTIGHKYFIKLPPFADWYYGIISKSLSFEYPYPKGYLDLKDDKKSEQWQKCWKNDYKRFFDTYYKIGANLEPLEIFRKTLIALKSYHNVLYPEISVIILIRTLEGLLYIDKVNNKVYNGKGGKKNPVADAFNAICKDNNKTWEYLVDSAHFKPTFDQSAHDQEIKMFIISTYDFRNRLMHLTDKGTLNFKPVHLYTHKKPDEYENYLTLLVKEWIPKFLNYLLKIWIKKGYQNKDDWFNYIGNLFP